MNVGFSLLLYDTDKPSFDPIHEYSGSAYAYSSGQFATGRDLA